MSSERYGDTDLVYWMGRSIAAMSNEEMQQTISEMRITIDNQRSYIAYLIAKEQIADAQHSRFTNPDYIASFC